MQTDFILILDFGGSQAYYTARRLRSEQFYCEILSGNATLDEIRARKPKGVILAGGDSRELRAKPLPFDPDALGVPILAFGGTARMLAERIGAEHRGIQIEAGKDFVQFSSCPLFEGLYENDRFFDRVDGYALPEGYTPIAETPSGLIPAFACKEKKIFALQFYVESNDPEGFRILENFAESVCGYPRCWMVENYLPRLIDDIREAVGDARLLLCVSAGLNSAVAASILQRALGNRLHCLFINTGFLHKGDIELVQKLYYEQLSMNLIEVDVRDRFLKALSGVQDPAEKKRIVFEEYSAVFAEQYIKCGDIEWMAEETTYSDLLHGSAAPITNMIDGCKCIQPLKYLFKEDIRSLARYLGVADDLTARPAFESCGLFTRCLGEITPERMRMLCEADAIFREEVKKAGLTHRIAQHFAILTNMRTPGCNGEGYVCVLRALGSSSAGKASACKLPYDLMDSVVQRITQEVAGINHVVYDITGRPTASVEWE